MFSVRVSALGQGLVRCSPAPASLVRGMRAAFSRYRYRDWLRRLRIFGQRDKLKTDRSKRGVRSGYKEKAAQRGIQSAGGDGGAFRGENPDGAVGRVWGSLDDDQQLEAGAGEACGGAVWARQQGAGGRGCAEGDRRSAPEDRTAAGRVRFSCRAARHLPSAERRAMIAPEAGLSVIRQCALLGVARSSFYYRSRPESAAELELLKRLPRGFPCKTA